MSRTVKTLRALPKSRGPAEAPAPAVEHPQQKLRRLMDEHAKTVEALQTLKREFAQRNLKAQTLHQAVSTPEITAFEAERKRLAQKVLDLNTEIGATNKAAREHRAERNGNGRAQPIAIIPQKTRPLKAEPDFLIYWKLACDNELEPTQLAHIQRVAKRMMADAIRNGVEE